MFPYMKTDNGTGAIVYFCCKHRILNGCIILQFDNGDIFHERQYLKFSDIMFFIEFAHV